MITLAAACIASTPVTGAQQAPTAAQLTAATDYATRTGSLAVLVLHDGVVVHERYMHGGSPARRELLASASKSFIGVAALAAAADGLLRLDGPVSDVLPEWRNASTKSAVTFRQLLSLESGLDPGMAGTGCGGPKRGWADAVAAPSQADPGTRFAYGPYPFIATGAAIERARTAKSFSEYLERRILKPLGITLEWRLRCGDGKPQLAGGAAMTARDLAVFGEFIRLGGVHKGRRLLADTLVSQLSRPSASNPSYGMSWWLSGAVAEVNPAAGRAVPTRRARARSDTPPWIPADLVMAAGAGKQRVYVIPGRKLVIVRLGPVRGGASFQDLGFLETLLR